MSSVSSDSAPASWLAEVAKIRSASPNILFFIKRSKNLNLVVYEALVDGSGEQLKSDQPVDVYWQDLDPEFISKANKEGRTNYRSDLNFIEKKMAYGLSSSPIDGKPGYYSVKLVSFPDRVVTVWYDKTLKRCRAKISINGIQSDLEQIFVATKETWTGPSVLYVELDGKDDEGKLQHEKVLPK